MDSFNHSSWNYFSYINFHQSNFLGSAIICVDVAPTDAALGQIMVNNKAIPRRIRETLEVKSGLNDGLSMPYLLIFIAIGLAEESFSPTEYFIQTALEQISLGALVGITVGLIGSGIFIKSRDKGGIHSRVSENLIIRCIGLGLFSSPNTSAIMGSVEKRYYGVTSPTVGTICMIRQMLSMGTVIMILSITMEMFR